MPRQQHQVEAQFRENQFSYRTWKVINVILLAKEAFHSEALCVFVCVCVCVCVWVELINEIASCFC